MSDSSPIDPLTGAELYFFRIQKGLKAKDVAASIGISPSYYSEIERGKKPIPGDGEFLGKFFAALKFTAEDFARIESETALQNPTDGDGFTLSQEIGTSSWEALAATFLAKKEEGEVIDLIISFLEAYRVDKEEVSDLLKAQAVIKYLIKSRLGMTPQFLIKTFIDDAKQSHLRRGGSAKDWSLILQKTYEALSK